MQRDAMAEAIRQGGGTVNLANETSAPNLQISLGNPEAGPSSRWYGPSSEPEVHAEM
jgi:hypothetical protein